MSSRRRQLPRGGGRLRGARRRQAPGDEPARWRPRRCSSARGGRALDASRGEPAFVFELGRAHAGVRRRGAGHEVDDRAGGARASRASNRFADVAYDTVAAIVNDLCCVGALPLVVNAYFATGSSDWYSASRARSTALRRGLAAGLRGRGLRTGAEASRRRCPGCSPRTRSSSPAPPWAPCRRARARSSASALAPGDEIVLVASSGLHANGASLARLIAGRLPDGYATDDPGRARASARRCSRRR